MPTIREYTSQTNVQSAGPIGGFDNPIPNLGAQVQQASDRIRDIQGRQEVSDVQRKIAAARAEWTVEITKRATEAPAGDPTFAETFNDDFAKFIEGQGQDYQTPAGQTAWQTASSELASHFVEQAGTFQIASAGVKAKADYLAALDLNRNTLQHDPSQYDSILQSTLDALRDPNGMYSLMPSEDRAKLENTTKNELGLSAFQGLAARDPNEALRQLNAGELDSRLDADKMLSANNLAERLIRAQELDILRAQAAQEKADKLADFAAQDEIFAALAKNEPNPLAKQVMLDDRIKPENKRAMLGVIEAATKPDPTGAVSDATETTLFARIHLPVGDPQKITNENILNDARAAGLLTQPALDRVRKEFTDARTPEGQTLGERTQDFLKGVEQQIDTPGLLGERDPLGGMAYDKYAMMVRRKIAEYQKAGKDPYDLMDESKPDFVGKPEIVKQYKPDPMTQINDLRALANDIRGAATPSAEPLAPVEYKSAAEVAAAYQSNKISREEATKILRDKGWAQ